MPLSSIYCTSDSHFSSYLEYLLKYGMLINNSDNSYYKSNKTISLQITPEALPDLFFVPFEQPGNRRCNHPFKS
jgi:hypothetical protein